MKNKKIKTSKTSTGSWRTIKATNNELCRLLLIIGDIQNGIMEKLTSEPSETSDSTWTEIQRLFNDFDYNLNKSYLDQKNLIDVRPNDFSERSGSRLKVY